MLFRDRYSGEPLGFLGLQMQLNMQNRTALITGASQGIGKEIALQLVKEGVQVAITSNDQNGLEKVAEQIIDMGGRAFVVAGDARVEGDIKNIVDQAIQHFGVINILINNVGHIGQVLAFDELGTEDWSDIFNLNVMSGVHFTKAVLPYMKKDRWGKIVFISSEKAIEPGVWMSHYAMSKAAVLSLAKSLANELGKDGITVNSISPGVIVTPAWDEGAQRSNIAREDYAAQFCRNVLKGQSLGNAEDVASLVCYLCSEAARWITGSNFRIDGGSVKSIQC